MLVQTKVVYTGFEVKRGFKDPSKEWIAISVCDLETGRAIEINAEMGISDLCQSIKRFSEVNLTLEVYPRREPRGAFGLNCRSIEAVKGTGVVNETTK
ncbi:MAG: hypothetical protein VB085_13635 [Peptococcaceae bacterium]|nr:hypothetical protein [Peptococcaceae bacterium]